MNRDDLNADQRERDGVFDHVVDRRVRRLLGSLIKLLRTEAGLTQEELSKRIFVPQSSLSKIERSHRDVTLLEFLAICHALEQNPQDVINRLFEDIDQQGHKRPGQF